MIQDRKIALHDEHVFCCCAKPPHHRATLLDVESSAEEKRKALQTLEDTLGVMRRVLGPQHPDTQRVQDEVEVCREEFPTTA